MSSVVRKNENFTINGTSSAIECGLFDALYSVIGPNSRAGFVSLAVDTNGKFQLFDFMPNVTEGEVYSFLNRPLRIFRKELDDGVITTSIRGMVNSDFVHLPYSSPVDLRKVIPEGQLVSAFLVDSATDEIKCIRNIGLSNKIIAQLLDDWITIEDRGFSVAEINRSLSDNVYCYSSKEYEKRSTYIGRDHSNIVSNNVFFLNHQWNNT